MSNLDFQFDRERIRRGYDALNKIEPLTLMQRERALKTWVRICKIIELFAKVVYYITDKFTALSHITYNCVLYSRDKVCYYKARYQEELWRKRK